MKTLRDMVLSLIDSIELYKQVGHRNTYLFEWLYDVYKDTCLSCVDPTYVPDLVLTKTKLTIFDVLIDDIADNAKTSNKELLLRLINIPFNNVAHADKYYTITNQIWIDCLNTIKHFPRYSEFEDIFFFDLKQIMISMEYSWLTNVYNYCNNFIEVDNYGHHGVMVMLHCMMDIMCSKNFDKNELGKARTAFFLAQRIARIGNMLNTYSREIIEKDISSPILTKTIEENIISYSDFDELPSSEIEKRVKNLEPLFAEEVTTYLDKITEISKRVHSVDLQKFMLDRKSIHEKFIKRIRYWESK